MSLAHLYLFTFLISYLSLSVRSGFSDRPEFSYYNWPWFNSQDDPGCSDYRCICEARQACTPDYATNHPCKTESLWGCFGPGIMTSFHIKLSRSVVESMLPDGLELAEYPNWNRNNYWPVQIVLAQQHNIASGLYNYLEVLVMVNYVQWNDEQAPNYQYRGPFAYGAKLYLDSFPGLYIGQFCGTNKEFANFTQTCDRRGNCDFTVFNPEDPDDLILDGEWSPKMPCDSGRCSRRRRNTNSYYEADEIDDWLDIHGAHYDLPYIFQYPVNEGVFQCGYANWFVDDALVQPVTGSLNIYRSLIGDLVPDSYDFRKTVIKDPKFGAYRMQTMWIFEFQCNNVQESCTTFVPTK